MTELASGLSKQGWRIRVYCAQPSYRDVQQSNEKISPKMEYEGVQIIRVPTFGGQDSWLILRGLNAGLYLLFTTIFLIRDRSELAGIFNTTNPPFLGIAAIMVRLVTGLRFVTLIYDVYPDVAICTGFLKQKAFLTAIWRYITRLILRWSDALVVIGFDMEHIIRTKLNEPDLVPMTIIRNWSDHRRVYPVPKTSNPFIEKQKSADFFVVQYSGRMGRTHNLEPLIEAAFLLQNKPILFQFIGDGAKREHLVQLAKSQGLKNVQFLPYQPFEELMNVLSAPQLAVVCLDSACSGLSVPSKSYGIMAAACPILGFLSPDSEIGRMIEEVGCGIVMPNPSGKDVAEQIENLMRNPEFIKQMGQKGYEAFLKRYTLDVAVEQYSQFLDTYFPQAKR